MFLIIQLYGKQKLTFLITFHTLVVNIHGRRDSVVAGLNLLLKIIQLYHKIVGIVVL